MISIIMVAYNAEKFLKPAIESVINQSISDWELLVVIDPSQDNTIKIAREFERDKKVNVIVNEKRLGISTSRNIGIKNSKGDYICFLDSDDIYENDKLEKQIDFMNKHDVAMIYTDYTEINENGKELEKVISDDFDIELLKDHNFIPCGSVMIRKSIVERVGGFDSAIKMAEDYDLWLRIALTGYKIERLPIFSYRRRLHPGQVSQWYLYKTGKIKERRGLEESLKQIKNKFNISC